MSRGNYVRVQRLAVQAGLAGFEGAPTRGRLQALGSLEERLLRRGRSGSWTSDVLASALDEARDAALAELAARARLLDAEAGGDPAALSRAARSLEDYALYGGEAAERVAALRAAVQGGEALAQARLWLDAPPVPTAMEGTPAPRGTGLRPWSAGPRERRDAVPSRSVAPAAGRPVGLGQAIAAMRWVATLPSGQRETARRRYPGLFGGGDAFPEFVARQDVPAAPYRVAVENQGADADEAVVELVSNAVDATAAAEGRTDLIKRFGVGFYQSLREIDGPAAAVLVQTRKPDGRALQARFSGGAEGLELALGEAGSLPAGTRIRVDKTLSRARRENLEKRLVERLGTSDAAPIHVNGRLINPLDGLVDEDGNPMRYRLAGRVDVRIDKDGYEVRDSGVGMDETGVLEKLLPPRSGDGLGAEAPARVEEARLRRTDAPAPGRLVRSEVRLNVSGVTIETLSLEGLGYPERAVIELPASSWLPESRNRITLDDAAIAALKRLIDRLTRTPAGLERNLPVLNLLAATLEALSSRARHASDAEGLMDHFHGRLGGLPGVERLREFRSDSRIAYVMHLEERDAQGREKVFVEYGRYIIFNRALYEKWRDFPALHELLINPRTHYEKATPEAVGRFEPAKTGPADGETPLPGDPAAAPGEARAPASPGVARAPGAASPAEWTPAADDPVDQWLRRVRLDGGLPLWREQPGLRDDLRRLLEFKDELLPEAARPGVWALLAREELIAGRLDRLFHNGRHWGLRTKKGRHLVDGRPTAAVEGKTALSPDGRFAGVETYGEFGTRARVLADGKDVSGGRTFAAVDALAWSGGQPLYAARSLGEAGMKVFHGGEELLGGPPGGWWRVSALSGGPEGALVVGEVQDAASGAKAAEDEEEAPPERPLPDMRASLGSLRWRLSGRMMAAERDFPTPTRFRMRPAVNTKPAVYLGEKEIPLPSGASEVATAHRLENGAVFLHGLTKHDVHWASWDGAPLELGGEVVEAVAADTAVHLLLKDGSELITLIPRPEGGPPEVRRRALPAGYRPKDLPDFPVLSLDGSGQPALLLAGTAGDVRMLTARGLGDDLGAVNAGGTGPSGLSYFRSRAGDQTLVVRDGRIIARAESYRTQGVIEQEGRLRLIVDHPDGLALATPDELSTPRVRNVGALDDPAVLAFVAENRALLNHPERGWGTRYLENLLRADLRRLPAADVQPLLPFLEPGAAALLDARSLRAVREVLGERPLAEWEEFSRFANAVHRHAGSPDHFGLLLERWAGFFTADRARALEFLGALGEHAELLAPGSDPDRAPAALRGYFYYLLSRTAEFVPETPLPEVPGRVLAELRDVPLARLIVAMRKRGGPAAPTARPSPLRRLMGWTGRRPAVPAPAGRLTLAELGRVLREYRGHSLDPVDRELRSVIKGQDRSLKLWAREFIQNARDAVRRKGLAGDDRRVDVSLFYTPGRTHFGARVRDGAGMPLEDQAYHLLVPDASSKSEGGGDAGFAGQGFFSVFADFPSVLVRTGAGGGVFHEILIEKDAEGRLIIKSWKELAGDYTGTEIIPLAPADSARPAGAELDAALAAHAVHFHGGAVQDTTITLQGKPANDRLTLLGESAVRAYGAVRLFVPESGLKRLAVDELPVLADMAPLFALTPDWMRRLLESKGANLYLTGFPVVRSRFGLARTERFLEDLQKAVATAAYQAVVRLYFKEGGDLGGTLPQDYFYERSHDVWAAMNPGALDRARRDAARLKRGDAADIDFAGYLQRPQDLARMLTLAALSEETHPRSIQDVRDAALSAGERGAPDPGDAASAISGLLGDLAHAAEKLGDRARAARNPVRTLSASEIAASPTLRLFHELAEAVCPLMGGKRRVRLFHHEGGPRATGTQGGDLISLNLAAFPELLGLAGMVKEGRLDPALLSDFLDTLSHEYAHTRERRGAWTHTSSRGAGSFLSLQAEALSEIVRNGGLREAVARLHERYRDVELDDPREAL